MYSSGNNIVDEVGKIAISGNIIPQMWFKTITKEGTGKPYLLAMMILADIVYWYRPVEVRDEGSGQVVGWKKKFRSDLYQRSYASFKEQFGEEVKTIQRAINRLEALGVVQRVFRTVEQNNVKLNNVMFLELNALALYDLTFGAEEKAPQGMDKNDHTSGQDCPQGMDKNDHISGQDCPYITNNINKDSITEIPSSSFPGGERVKDDDDKIKKHIQYDRLMQSVKDPAVLDALLNVLRNNENLAIHTTYHSAMSVLSKISSSAKKINNLENYLCKSLENELIEHNSYYAAQSGSGGRQNHFCSFQQNSYDFDELERELLSNV